MGTAWGQAEPSADELAIAWYISTHEPVLRALPGGIRFVRPELLLVMHLLRPGPQAALAAIELAIARREKGGLDVTYTRHWVSRLDRAERLERVLEQADALGLI